MENSLRKYEIIHEDCYKILGSQKHLDVFGLSKSQEPSVKQMEEFKKYAERFLNDKVNNGELRTILVIGKPYRNHPVIRDLFEVLADRLRSRSKSGKI